MGVRHLGIIGGACNRTRVRMDRLGGKMSRETPEEFLFG